MRLAEEVGLHPTYISGIERGTRNVSLVNIHVLAKGLGVSPAELFQ
jgi:transcriptional regulator with XRE-family HTH domain